MGLLKNKGKELGDRDVGAPAVETRRLDDFPDYVKARNKLNELGDREKALDQQLGAIVKQETETLDADIKGFLVTGVLPDFTRREDNDRVRRQELLQAELRFIREAIPVQEAALEEITDQLVRIICVRVPQDEETDAHARHLQRYNRP
jgi:hypothetical protein